MRLTLLIRDLGYGGAQRQVVALATAARAHGMDPTVVTFYSGPQAQALHDAGVTVIALEKQHRWDLVGFLWRLVAAVRSSQPDVLYSFLSESNVVAALLRPLLPSHTQIVWGLRDSSTDNGLYGLMGRLTFAMAKACRDLPDQHIANSHAGARYYAEQGYAADRIAIVPNGIDTARFTPDASIVREPCTFALIGRLSPMKDYATFLRALALVPDAKALLIGSGSESYRNDMRALADQLGIAARLTWSPPRDDMLRVYRSITAVVSSSAYGEGFSNVIGEAMACGTPCIATDVGDSAMLIGDARFIVSAGDHAALARAMQAMLEADREALGQQARARMEQEFSIKRMVERTTACFASLKPPTPISVTLSKPLFITTALGSGGAEMMLTQLVTHLDRARFAPEVISLVDGGKHADTLRAAGIPVHSLGFIAGRPTLRGLWRLLQIVRSVDPQMLIGWMYHGCLGATLASWMVLGRPVLWSIRQTLYDLAQEKRGSALVIRALAWLGFNPQRILYNSTLSSQQHEAIGYPAHKRCIITNGFDTERFAPKHADRAALIAELGLPADALLIGRFGRKAAMKDYPTFLGAARLVAQQMPNAHFIIAGTETNDLPAQPNVHLLGERHDLPRLTASIDLACSSSAFGDAFPNVVAEAMCSGVPCVVTDIGDSAWVLGDAGIVVPPRDPNALAEAMLRILRDPQRTSIGARGRQRVLEHFTLEKSISAFEMLLHPSSFIPHPSTPCAA